MSINLDNQSLMHPLKEDQVSTMAVTVQWIVIWFSIVIPVEAFFLKGESGFAGLISMILFHSFQ